MPYQKPILIVSDLHLSHEGNWRSVIQQLRSLWCGMKTVVLNGDTLGWTTALEKREADRVLDELAVCARRDGVEIVTLAGNSDYRISHRRHLFLDDKRILIMHGDAVFKAVSPWRRESQLLARFRQNGLKRQSAHRQKSLIGQLRSVHNAMIKHEHLCVSEQKGGPKVLPGGWVSMIWGVVRGGCLLCRVWATFPRLCTQFVDSYAPDVSIVIIGHFHRSGVWQCGGRTVVNTGHFGWCGNPLAVVVDAGKVSVSKIKRDKGAFVRQLPFTEFNV